MKLTLINYVLKAAGRDKLFLSMFIGVILAVALSFFMSSAAVTEKAQFSLVYMAGSLRLLAIAGLSLFIVFFIRRSHEARDVEYLLTRPMSRVNFILSHGAAFSLLAFIVTGLLTLCVTGFAFRYNQISMGMFLWLAGVGGELLITANVAFFFAMVLSSPVSASMATLGFYVLARLMGQLLAIVSESFTMFPGSELLVHILQAVSMVIPRFDLMTQTSWLLYDVTNVLKDYIFIVIQSLFFLGMIWVATMIDFVKRQF
jgi:hypothetical protein